MEQRIPRLVDTEDYNLLVERILKRANYLLHKEHPMITLQDWEVKYVLSAYAYILGEDMAYILEFTKTKTKNEVTNP